MAKLLIISGILLVLIGIGMLLAPRIPWLGHLPGDIHIQGKSGSFYFPIVTCILISIILSIIMNLIGRR